MIVTVGFAQQKVAFGLLKVRTGAHEVIVTIMLNYVAIQMTSFLVGGPMNCLAVRS
jgi:ABC-type uncharacterized transport system permease subunit